MRLALIALVFVPLLASADPVRSGLEVGRRPGPYSSLVVVGPQRGTQHCFVCEAESRPTIIVFARSASDPLGKLVHEIDRVVKKHAMADVRAWATFLADDAGPLEPKLIAWSQKHATGAVPITIFEDAVGPPAFRVSREADVTLMISRNAKVAATFAFRAGELTPAAIEAIIRSADSVVSAK